jgi:O-antigen ligase
VALVAGGRSGLAERADAQLLAASSAQRLQLYGVTLEMIAERPIVGHGVGSWRPLWQQRNRDPAMAGFNTAHQEPLQFAQQGGLVAVALLLATWAAWLRAAWPGPGEASAALLAWAAFVLTAMFNAAIRDLSFGLPLLTMLGLTLAASRRS